MTTQEQEHNHKVTVLHNQLELKDKEIETLQLQQSKQQKRIRFAFDKDLQSQQQHRDDLAQIMKKQQDEFLIKELQFQEKITRGREENRKLEERVNDEIKVVENLRNINQRLKDDIAKKEQEHAKEINKL